MHEVWYALPLGGSLLMNLMNSIQEFINLLKTCFHLQAYAYVAHKQFNTRLLAINFRILEFKFTKDIRILMALKLLWKSCCSSAIAKEHMGKTIVVRKPWWYNLLI